MKYFLLSILVSILLVFLNKKLGIRRVQEERQCQCVLKPKGCSLVGRGTDILVLFHVSYFNRNKLIKQKIFPQKSNPEFMYGYSSNVNREGFLWP